MWFLFREFLRYGKHEIKKIKIFLATNSSVVKCLILPQKKKMTKEGRTGIKSEGVCV